VPFSSLEFLFLFLPLTLIAFYTLVWIGWRDKCYLVLLLASLAFYGAYNRTPVLLLVGSVVVNYTIGLLIERRKQAQQSTSLTLALGIVLNLMFLGYYKYANFFLDTVNSLAGTQHTLQKMILPIGISFYTFQQIAYLVDIARDTIRPGGIASYSAFIIFFPQLLAGPISHYKDIAPQFFHRNLGRFCLSNLIIGTAIFAIGLFKKTVIADSAARFTSPIFSAAHAGETISLIDGWNAAVCYTIQLYFDFSGYSDMATGVSRMFGILLPLNFHSPLRATSIIEYWRRWHITLQQFIVSYMYQPCVLPLARIAAERGLKRWGNFWLTVALPTLLIFVVLGLWHGAGWTFILFGLMHGIYLTVNEFWRLLCRDARKKKGQPKGWYLWAYYVLTLVAVMFANVIFRADRVSDAISVWSGMLRWQEAGHLIDIFPSTVAELITEPLLFVLACGFILIACPNTQQIMGRYSPILAWSKWKNVSPPNIKLEFRLTTAWALYFGLILFFGLAFVSRGQTEFIYFNF